MLHTGKPVEVMLAAIQSLDLESVKARVMDPKLGEGWSREYADSIERAYRTYLSMLVRHPEDILLSKDVDEFWHTHILQTMKYHSDCEAVFGKYLHHEPHVGEVTVEDLARREAQAETTRRLYAAEFGAGLHAAWAGDAVAAGQAAFSGVTAVESAKAAFSGAGVQDKGIRAMQAAFSGAAGIDAKKAAFSGAAAIASAKAAFSGASVRASEAAFSGTRIATEEAAFSGAAIKAADAAFSGASVDAGNAAFSGARVGGQR
jgi:hypothetical protein